MYYHGKIQFGLNQHKKILLESCFFVKRQLFFLTFFAKIHKKRDLKKETQNEKIFTSKNR